MSELCNCFAPNWAPSEEGQCLECEAIEALPLFRDGNEMKFPEDVCMKPQERDYAFLRFQILQLRLLHGLSQKDRSQIRIFQTEIRNL